MKLKYYLRGIGIGMIVTTIILMITFAVHGNQPLTDDEIRERAAELGMVMVEDLPVSDTLADTDQSGQGDDEKDGADDAQAASQSPSDDGANDAKADADGDAAKGAKADADGDAAKDGQSGSKAQEQENGDKKENRPQRDVVEQVEITIVGGEYSNDVCRKLKRAGLIEDIDDFNKYLSDGGYDNLIQPGNYTIPTGADYDEIIKIITEKER